MRLGRIKKRRLLLITAILIALFVVSFFSREYLSNIFVGYIMDEIEVPGENDRLLVFAPHSDDEALGAANLIKRSIQNGALAKVVIVTNGDGFRRAVSIEAISIFPKPQDYIKYGYTRQSESINAMEVLGLKSEDVLFLGYPDRGISSMWSSNWMNDIPYKSGYTKTDRSPYSNSYGGEVLYSGQSLYNDIVGIISDFQPTHIVYPHSNDRHPDHWALNTFVKYSITSIGYKPQEEWLYLVHRGGWPTPLSRNRNMFLVPPMSLLSTGTDWLTLEMTDEDIEEKALVFKQYKSQIKRISALMAGFERKNELFGVYDNALLVKYQRHDDDIDVNDENSIIEDPKKDALNLEVRANFDIAGVFAEASTEKNLHVLIQLNKKQDTITTFVLNIIFIKDGGASIPLKLAIKGKSIKALQVSDSSIIDLEGIQYKSENKVIHVIIPESKIGDYNNIFMNAESYVNTYCMDRSAWRMVDVGNNPEE